MKITLSNLKKIINEEINKFIAEQQKPPSSSDLAHLKNIKAALEKDGVKVAKSSGEAQNEFDKFMFDIIDVVDALKNSKKYKISSKDMNKLTSYPGDLKTLQIQIGIISNILRKQGKLNLVLQTADPNSVNFGR